MQLHKFFHDNQFNSLKIHLSFPDLSFHRLRPESRKIVIFACVHLISVGERSGQEVAKGYERGAGTDP